MYGKIKNVPNHQPGYNFGESVCSSLEKLKKAKTSDPEILMMPVPAVTFIDISQLHRFVGQ